VDGFLAFQNLSKNNRQHCVDTSNRTETFQRFEILFFHLCSLD
jgi:hypothetical protein